MNSDGHPSSSALWVALAAVVGVSFVGFGAGTWAQRATSAPRREAPLAEATAATARPYRELRETIAAPVRAFPERTLTPSGAEPPEPVPSAVDAAAVEAVLVARATRRAYDGAPPTVPHPVPQQDPSACLACHGRGLEIGALRANFPSHHPMASCTQCHVPAESPVPGGVNAAPLPLANAVTLAAQRGPRAWGGAPPVIPHPTWMREQCLACHGPAGHAPIQSSHPWRQSCTQCHAPWGERDQSP